MPEKIYLIPGLGADKRVFRHLSMPHDNYATIKWITPLKDESLKEYSARLSDQIEATPAILIGVSFGGMVAMELNRILPFKKVILISSARNSKALPSLFKSIGRTGLVRYIPSVFFKWTPWYILNYLFGVKSYSDKKLLKEIIKDTEPEFVRWALNAIATWDYTGSKENVITIHGNKDRLIPLSVADHQIESGGHFMIVNKSQDISRIISEIIR